MQETTIQRPETRLVDVLDVHRVDAATGRVTDVVALRVGGIDAPDAKSVQEALRKIEPQRLADALHAMLDVDLFKLFVGAWRQLLKVQQAVKKSVGPPAAEQQVDLPRHEVAGKLKPRLVLNLAGVDFADVDFEIALSVSILSARLTIEGGALTAVRFGDTKGTLKLACEGTPIHEYSRELKLLAEYRFSHPIALT
jgi:hypothetical protein